MSLTYLLVPLWILIETMGRTVQPVILQHVENCSLGLAASDSFKKGYIQNDLKFVEFFFFFFFLTLYCTFCRY